MDDLLITGASGYLGAELARRAPGATGTFLTADRPAPPGGDRGGVRVVSIDTGHRIAAPLACWLGGKTGASLEELQAAVTTAWAL